jgi:hypothetical protein
LAAPQNQGFVKLRNFPREGKDLGKRKIIFGYMGYVRRQDAA